MLPRWALFIVVPVVVVVWLVTKPFALLNDWAGGQLDPG